MFYCHTCKRDIDLEALGFLPDVQRQWHNAVHQREAIRAGLDRLERMAEAAENAGLRTAASDLREIVASMERDEYIDPPKENPPN